MNRDALRAALRSIVAAAPAGKIAFGEEFLGGEAGAIGHTDDAWAEGAEARLDAAPKAGTDELGAPGIGVRGPVSPAGEARETRAERFGAAPGSGDGPGFAAAPDGPPPSGAVASPPAGAVASPAVAAAAKVRISASRTELSAAAAASSVSGSAPGFSAREGGLSTPTPAAVLVPFVLGEPMGVLLTKRTAHLKRHAGQVSFPGGRIDATDASPEAAALREAQEEIALDPACVEVLGRLPDHLTGTGYRITPVVGLLPPGAEYTLSPHEVESIFELPLSVLLDPNAPQRQRQHVNGRWREYWVWPHPEHFIWGATAAILVHLAQQLRQHA